ncbi:Na+/H+ antiporter subunit E [Marimonas arenosa]|uniref:Na+/H+ antiporter subunit E n=1 Tax=Marimonas arenosa TaxID=1795305 RepID=A0AAE3WHZ4_9RHOB|nr:Na+/H+ antiporter subunit E [Marimonas arenosa]MDQ2092162.1 Na+/H+ antiporter subunit E [Marimonas arenosa]
MRIIGAFVVLVVLWLLLSGIYTPMIVGLGVASAGLAVLVVRRMDLVDSDPVELALKPLGFPLYLFWLLGEIAKANWAVTRIILAAQMPIRQHLFAVQVTQKTDLGQVIFANSITLTPGTITVETEPERFLVHAVAYTPGTIGELTEMDRRVSAAEAV